MTCPLSAFADIAAMAADCQSATRRADATSSPAPSSTSATAPRPAEFTKKRSVPLKKRSVSAAHLESSDRGRFDALGASHKKARMARTATPSPLHEHPFAGGWDERRPFPVAARSVTPPESIASSHFGMLQHHAAATAPFMTRDSSPTPQWIFQSGLLEQMKVQQALEQMKVQQATNDIVSAAVAALNVAVAQREQPPPCHEPAASSPRLDAMTEAFIQRSRARTMRSRPMGIRGSSSPTRALPARRWRREAVSFRREVEINEPFLSWN